MRLRISRTSIAFVAVTLLCAACVVQPVAPSPSPSAPEGTEPAAGKAVSTVVSSEEEQSDG